MAKFLLLKLAWHCRKNGMSACMSLTRDSLRFGVGPVKELGGGK